MCFNSTILFNKKFITNTVKYGYMKYGHISQVVA
jgi:hypothetical protein